MGRLSPSFARPILVGLLFCGQLAACGYQLEGRGVFLPQHIHKVAVPGFENKSAQQELGTSITNAILAELGRRGGLELVQDPEQADGVLHGTIEQYQLSVLTTESDGRASAYRISITAKIVFEDRVEKKPYWQNTLSKIEDFTLDDSAASTELQERQAIDDASEEFAKTIVNAIFLGF